jgi:hypothetical protein
MSANHHRVVGTVSGVTGDTPAGGSAGNEGGPGWHVRAPRQQPDQIANTPRSAAPLPPDHLTPLSSVPPVGGQPLPTAPPSPTRPLAAGQAKLPPLPPLPRPGDAAAGPAPRRNVAMIAVGAVALFGLVGGGAVLLSGNKTGTAPPSTAGGGPAGNATNGKAVLTAAVNKFNATPARADITMTQSFSATGAGGEDLGELVGGDITYQVHIDQQSPTRSEMRETVTAFGIKETIIGVRYDDTVYLSTDNGATYKSTTIDKADKANVNPNDPLAFLTMIGDVTPTGGVEVNGVSAASYHAVLDPVKLGNYEKNSLASANDPVLDAMLDHIGVTDGYSDVAINPNGQMISETSQVDVALDMGAVSPVDQGSTLNMKQQYTGAFSDYGASINIDKPANVTGTATI